MKTLFSKIFVGWAFVVYKSPQWIQRFMGRLVGTLWFDILRIRRQVAIENVKRAFPNISEKRATQIARASLLHMGRTLVEFNHMFFYNDKKFSDYFEFENREFYEEALAEGKGVLMLGLHLANGDFGISALSGRGYKIHLISKRFKTQWLDKLWFGVRGKHGTQFISPRKSSFEILKALKAKSTVIFVLDQFMGPPLGVRTQFFGHETGTAFGLALFAQKTGVPVVPCHTYRRDDGKTVICFEPPIDFEEKDSKKQTLQFMTQKYTDKIEEIIRRHPEQWMWIHRRWKEFRD